MFLHADFKKLIFKRSLKKWKNPVKETHSWIEEENTGLKTQKSLERKGGRTSDI